ncbi:MAG TPA: HlyD family efflux transporter periplasmic adaptor subunit [Longimicrobiaceae bacterium]|nr:HlyD family efflux transporter periplasmic adaptor subunit [Longimicrobiaceae bacterium]
MPPRLSGIDELEDTIEVYLARHSRRSHAVYLLVVAILVVAIVALPLVRVSVSVGAAGILRPALDLQEVRAPIAGQVAEVLVRRGDAVARGQALVVLASDVSRAEMERLERRSDEVAAALRDLDVLLGASDAGSLAMAVAGLTELEQERRQLLEELAEADLRVGRARSELERVRALAGLDLVSRQELESREAEARQALAGGVLLLARRRTGWESRRSSLHREAGDLAAQLARAREELALHTISAPTAGTVEDLDAAVAGRFVRAGEPVATVSPDESLVAEAFVGPGDIGLLRPGMPVRLHVDAFNYLDWGYLTGRIAAISADYVLVQDRPAFRVLVELDGGHLSLRSGFVGELRKGMTLQARFLVAERTLLQILRDDVANWVHPWQSPAAAAPL